MKKLFFKLINFGIKEHHSDAVAEKMKLVNGISFLGVPICLFYVILLGATGDYFHSLVFLCGVLIFMLPIFLNATFGLQVSRPFIGIMAPVFFGVAHIVSGRDSGFYLGFLVIAVPPMIIYSSIRKSLFYIGVCVFMLMASITASMYIPPVGKIEFTMGIFLVNLFAVLFTSIAVVYIFKRELSASRDKLQEKNKEITDSINYAYRIQNAILPPEKYMRQFLNEIFIMYKPKDIIAGDFYWFFAEADEGLSREEWKNQILIAAADCTGHGVPGAMVSVVCCNALNRAVKEFGMIDPGQILDKTRELVLETFAKSDSEVKDGMDISLASIHPQTNEVKWAGANNPLWYVNKGEIKELTAHKQPIGKTDHPIPFPTHTLQLDKGDVIFLFTDGYADQFGGEHGKKFKYKPLKEMLVKNAPLSLEEQKKKLETVFHDWKNGLEQVDDVCVIGVRL